MPIDRSMLSPGNADYKRVEQALNDREWVSEWRVEEVMDFDGRFGHWFEGRFAIERRRRERYAQDGQGPILPGDFFEPEIRVEIKARKYEQVVETFWNVLESTKEARTLDLAEA
jgi:hypothetical protein